MKIFGVTGWKNSGKTGLMERLVTHFSAQGLRVSTIKHAHHAFDVDTPGRDSHRHRTAGAVEVLVASRQRVALMTELRGEAEPPLGALLARLAPVDLVLIEGYKDAPHPKIECRRAENDHPAIADGNGTIVAIASDGDGDGALPSFALDDTAGIAGFIAATVAL